MYMNAVQPLCSPNVYECNVQNRNKHINDEPDFIKMHKNAKITPNQI